MSAYAPVNLEEKLRRFSERWAPRVVAEMNDTQFKLVKLQGEFVWHIHENSDEAFLVLAGSMEIEFRDGSATLHPGELFVVPKGAEHRTRALHECHVLIVEARGVVNTGTAGGDLTSPDNVWV